MGFRNSILAGLTLVREAIESEGFQSGVQGWRIARDGTAEFLNILARGDIEASRLRVIAPFGQGVAEVSPAFSVPAYRFLFPDNPLWAINGQSGYLLGELTGLAGSTLRGAIEIAAPRLSNAHGTPQIRIEGLQEDGNNTPSVSFTANGLVSQGFFIRMDDFRIRGIRAPSMRSSFVFDGATLNPTISTTPQASGTGLVFTAPISGIVTISWNDFMRLEVATTASRSMDSRTEVREGSTIGSGTVVLGTSVNRRASINCTGISPNMIGATAHAEMPVTGLTPGDQYNVQIFHNTNNAASVNAFNSLQRTITVRPEM